MSIAPTPRTVALYARVSTQRQEQEATIDSQIGEIEQYAHAHGYQILDRYLALARG